MSWQDELQQILNGGLTVSNWKWYAEAHLNSELPTVITNIQANPTPFIIDCVLKVDDLNSVLVYRSFTNNS